MREKTRRVQLSLVFLILGLVCVLIPFYLVVITSLKDMQQVSSCLLYTSHREKKAGSCCGKENFMIFSMFGLENFHA